MPETIAAATKRLEQAIPLAKAASWDAVGLQVGDPAAPVARAVVCHEVTEDVVAQAQSGDLVISYHPLLFRPTTAFVAGKSATGRAYRLTKRGAALYVVHTAFDVASGGCAEALAAALGLKNVVGFGATWPADSSKIVTFVPGSAAADLTAAMAAAGGGHIGRYSECSFAIDGVGSYRPGAGASPLVGKPGELSREPEVRVEMHLPSSATEAVVSALVASHPYDEPAFDVYATRANAGFVGRVGVLGHPTALGALAADTVAGALATAVKTAGNPDRIVSRIAVVPGSGSELVGAAADAGADVIVTGDVSHHRANEAVARGLAVIDAGHVATERPGVAKLYSLVSELFDEVVDLTHIDPSPWGIA